MIKNGLLTLTALWITGTIVFATEAVAQSAFDIDLFNAPSKQTTQKQVDAAPKEKKSGVDTKNGFNESLALTDEEVGGDKKADSSSYNNESETWLQSIFTKGTEELFKSQDPKVLAAEKKRIEQVLMNRKSNAANFDISGIKLRMKPEEVEKIMLSNGFRRIVQTTEIPNFIKWRSEELCRQHGVIGFERLSACASKVSEANGYRFIEHEIYNRQLTKEKIEIFYTSTFTDNLSHRIYYVSDVPLYDSKASKHVYINNLKVYEFWRRIDLRYGEPDNASEVKWGLGGKKPYLRAETGKLELVDPLLKDLDMSRMLNEDTRFANTQYYTF